MDIKPVAFLCEHSVGGRYWSTNVTVHDLPLGGYYDQSAIDALTAEVERLRTSCASSQAGLAMAESVISRLEVEAARLRKHVPVALRGEG